MTHISETRREILASGITRYYRLVLQELAGKRNLYRTSEEMKGGREKKSLIVRTLFKTQRGGSRVSEDKDFPEARDLTLSEGRKKPATGTGTREGQSHEPRLEEGETRETNEKPKPGDPKQSLQSRPKGRESARQRAKNQMNKRAPRPKEPDLEAWRSEPGAPRPEPQRLQEREPKPQPLEPALWC